MSCVPLWIENAFSNWDFEITTKPPNPPPFVRLRAIQLHLQKKWVYVFFNESLQIAFPNNVLVSKFHDECG